MNPHSVRNFPHRTIGSTVHWYRSLPSTNDLATELGRDAANAGAAIVADQQSAGRGQYGRVWHSRAGAALLMSVIIPASAGMRPVVLTAWAACAVAAAVERLCGRRPRLKWPNDLLVNDRKVCGILIEQSHAVVLGVGLNLDQSQEEFQDALLPDATSLRLLRDPDAERLVVDEVCRVVLDALNEGYERCFIETSGLDSEESDWRELIGLEGGMVTLQTHDGREFVGRLRTLSFAGLELATDAVVSTFFPPEAVRGLRAL